MKNRIYLIVCLLLATIIVLSSCVAKRRYVNAKMRGDKLKSENTVLNDRVEEQGNTITQLNGQVNQLNGQVAKLGETNENTANQLNMTKEQIAAQRQRLQQLQDFIDQQQKAVTALKNKLTDALVGFNSSEVLISMKNGRVYVSMQESLLFPSGSAVVNPKGKEALAKVAGVLYNNSDISIDIEGHTDNVPIHTKIYPDNWALSVARATSIAHVLLDEYHVSPDKLVASGRGEYDPVATNETKEGRQLNRRTEIILEPKYDELMKLMNGSVPFPASTAHQ